MAMADRSKAGDIISSSFAEPCFITARKASVPGMLAKRIVCEHCLHGCFDFYFCFAPIYPKVDDQN